MRRTFRIFSVISPLLFMIALGGGIWIGSRLNSSSGRSAEREKYDRILDLIISQYVDKVDIDSLMEMNIPDLLSYLDPHTVYIPASDFEVVNDDLEGSFSGVGISFQILNDTVVVVEVIPGGPADKVGLLAGDRLVKADTVDMTGPELSSETVFKTLRGKEGTMVKLLLKRPGVKETLKYDVARGEIPVNSVDAKYMADKNVGYVRISKFARNTYAEYLEALVELRSKGATKAIIDLRGNSGGYMDQAILMANELLPKGKTIVYTLGRTPENEYYAYSDGRGDFQDMEVVVLTDEFSASASEIFAGAIQDNDRGLVIGRRTFGKGLVQNQFMLPDNSAVRLTVARYFTPTGRSIQKEYQRGANGKYDLDLMERYSRGEFYNADSVKLDKSKRYLTPQGRTVYGGGGIMPDLFVPDDTTGYTSYYATVINKGLIPKYAMKVADDYRNVVKGVTTPEQLLSRIPRDETLLENFVDYATTQGVPARWYYINQSRDLLLKQIKAVIARDVIGYDAYFRIINSDDAVIKRAIQELNAGKSPTVITKKSKN